jgi:hypothetical protein
MSRWQNILTAIQVRFKSITISGGYHTDFGTDHVFICRREKIEPQDSPAINIWDSLETVKIGDITSGSDSLEDWKMPVTVEVLVQGTDAQVRAAVADVYKAIGTDPTWGGLAQYTYLWKHSLTVEQADRKVSGATITFYVQYRNKTFQES